MVRPRWGARGKYVGSAFLKTRPHKVTNFLVVEVFGIVVRILFKEADMKRLFFWLFVLLIGALDWAALHDILNGEPDTWLEWTFVIASALLLLIFLFRKAKEVKAR
jgi:hypothetical protein